MREMSPLWLWVEPFAAEMKAASLWESRKGTLQYMVDEDIEQGRGNDTALAHAGPGALAHAE